MVGGLAASGARGWLGPDYIGAAIPVSMESRPRGTRALQHLGSCRAGLPPLLAMSEVEGPRPAARATTPCA